MTATDPQSRRERAVGAAKHGAGFVVSGGLAFATDATILGALHHGLGINPLIARILAIGTAMVVAWLAHRRLTFDVANPPSLREFGKFAAVASGAAALNYAVFAAILFFRAGTEPLLALVAATGIAMVASYLGMRFGVFERPDLDRS